MSSRLRYRVAEFRKPSVSFSRLRGIISPPNADFGNATGHTTNTRLGNEGKSLIKIEVGRQITDKQKAFSK